MTDQLEEYRSRRDFAKTPEPAPGRRRGAGGGKPLKDGEFVVQKHAARRLHFDFRLAVDGVLKSWAVTKGPSFDPGEKRLAVRTEDHPVEYGDFEGVIPKGEYGGGTVMLWDRGSFRSQGDPAEGVEAGKLKLTLDGERLRGGFTLVRMRPRKGEKRENWLLIKERDEAADPGLDIGAYETSVATGRTMAAIAGDRGSREWTASGETKRRAKAPRVSTGKRPGFVAPQLATLVDEAPTGANWFFEPKFDGYRMLAAAGNGQVRCFTRSGKDWTDRFAPVAEALNGLGLKGALLDGEIVVADDKGRTDFGALQKALKDAPGDLSYFAFDLLFSDGEDLRDLPNLERKTRLGALLRNAGPPVHFTEHVEGDGARIAASACRNGLEGIIAKRADAAYRSRRSRAWLKVKCVKEQEFVVGGWSASTRSRPFSSLLLGVYEGDELRYAGRVGTGFDTEQLERIAAELKKRARKTPPFSTVPAPVRRNAHWVTPDLVAEVRYAEMTGSGQVRHGVFVGLRQDKDAGEIRLEVAEPVESKTGKDGAEAMGNQSGGKSGDKPGSVAGVRLTHPERVLFPRMGVTKADLARYYERIAPLMLAHIAGRPVSLVRCPQGRQQDCFFQKHAGAAIGSEIGRVEISEKAGKSRTYLVVESLEALVSCAQIGALELHVWAARRDRLERPDRMVFDLDPGEGVGFGEVRRAAADLKGVLGEAGLDCFPLLTGGKGVHLVVPVERRQGWETFAGFARAFAHKMAELDSGRFVAGMSKAKRRGRIFIDHLRNQRGSTAVAPFSPRARDGAPVAVPVDWEELAEVSGPDAFRLDDPAQVEARAEAWAGYADTRQRLTRSGAARIGIELKD